MSKKANGITVEESCIDFGEQYPDKAVKAIRKFEARGYDVEIKDVDGGCRFTLFAPNREPLEQTRTYKDFNSCLHDARIILLAMVRFDMQREGVWKEDWDEEPVKKKGRKSNAGLHDVAVS